MPNICNFSCMVTGPKKGIDRFIQAAQTDYSVGNLNEPEHFWRVFNFYEDSLKDLGNDIWQLQASGDCAWSVHTCFTESGYQAQWNKSKSKHNGITIEQLCTKEKLIIEFFSDEIGMGFAEHIINVVNHLYLDETYDYTECDVEMELEELNERSGNNWTQEQWNEYFKKEDYYICCECDWKFADHLKLLEDYIYEY